MNELDSVGLVDRSEPSIVLRGRSLGTDIEAYCLAGEGVAVHTLMRKLRRRLLARVHRQD